MSYNDRCQLRYFSAIFEKKLQFKHHLLIGGWTKQDGQRNIHIYKQRDIQYTGYSHAHLGLEVVLQILNNQIYILNSVNSSLVIVSVSVVFQ